jgi:hypothetical protein
MVTTESEMDQVCRHVEEGRCHVHRQREIVAGLHEINADTTLAEQLLVSFEETLDLHLAHFSRLVAS